MENLGKPDNAKNLTCQTSRSEYGSEYSDFKNILAGVPQG